MLFCSFQYFDSSPLLQRRKAHEACTIAHRVTPTLAFGKCLNMTWFCLMPLCSWYSLAWNALALCSIPAPSYKPVLSPIGPSVLREAFHDILLSIQNSFVKYSLRIVFLSFTAFFSVCTDREHFVELFDKGLPDPETEG